jgi:hypothetical protein
LTVRRAPRRGKRKIGYIRCRSQGGVSRESAKNDGSGYIGCSTRNPCNPEPRKTGLSVTSLSEAQTSARNLTVWRAPRRGKRKIGYIRCGWQGGVSRESAKNDGSGFIRCSTRNPCNPEPRKTGLWVTSLSEALTSARNLTVWRPGIPAEPEYLLATSQRRPSTPFVTNGALQRVIRSESRDRLGWGPEPQRLRRMEEHASGPSPCPPSTG